MALRIAAVPMTLSDLQGHSFTAFSNVFSYSSAAFYKISTDTVHHEFVSDS